MWNMVDNFDVGMWLGTVVWNVPENGDVGAQRVILLLSIVKPLLELVFL